MITEYAVASSQNVNEYVVQVNWYLKEGWTFLNPERNLLVTPNGGRFLFTCEFTRTRKEAAAS